MSPSSHAMPRLKGAAVLQMLNETWPAGFVREPAIFYTAGAPVVKNGIVHVRRARGVAELLGGLISREEVTADYRETQRVALARGADVPGIGEKVHYNCYFPWTARETPQGSPHWRLNKFLAGYIGGVKVRDIATEVADTVFGSAAGQQRIDVCRLAEQMSSIVTARLLRLPDVSIPAMQEAVREYENRKGEFAWLKPATPEFDQALEELFSDYGDQPGFVRDVKVEYARQKISFEERNALVWGAYAAAYGTTATAINLLVAHIIGFGLQERLLANRDNAPFKEGLCAESLRMGSPMSAVPLYVVKNTMCDGLPLQAGQIVYAVLSAANFDATLFVDPYRFNPTRRNLDRHVAYGSGMHKCIGLHWANAQISAALGAMVTHGFFSSGYAIERIERNVNLVDVVPVLTLVRP